MVPKRHQQDRGVSRKEHCAIQGTVWVRGELRNNELGTRANNNERWKAETKRSSIKDMSLSYVLSALNSICVIYG